MPAFICTTCGCQYPNTEAPPAGCLICQDDRQYVNPAGQAWTTLPAMRKTYFNAFRRLEPGLMGVGTLPAFAIGQRALVLRSPAGNILWDCISFLDETTVTIIDGTGRASRGSPARIRISRLGGGMEPRVRQRPGLCARMDRKFVTRLDPVLRSGKATGWN